MIRSSKERQNANHRQLRATLVKILGFASSRVKDWEPTTINPYAKTAAAQ
jgi:hypothetical protein